MHIFEPQTIKNFSISIIKNSQASQMTIHKEKQFKKKKLNLNKLQPLHHQVAKILTKYRVNLNLSYKRSFKRKGNISIYRTMSINLEDLFILLLKKKSFVSK